MNDFKFEIVKHYGTLATSSTGWKKEVNLVSWNNSPARLDIRDWSPDHERMGRGINFTPDEAGKLYMLLAEAMADPSWQE